MKKLLTIIICVCFIYTHMKAQVSKSTWVSEFKKNNQLFIGAKSNLLPKIDNGTKFIQPEIGISINSYLPLWMQKKLSLGINIDGNYNFRLNKNIYNYIEPAAFQVIGQTGTSSVSTNSSSSNRLHYYSFAAGPQFNIYLGKSIILSPIALIGYQQNRTASFYSNQNLSYNGTDYKLLIKSKEISTSSNLCIMPKLRLQYMINRFLGVWLEGGYSYNFKETIREGILTPLSPPHNEQYNFGDIIDAQPEYTSTSYQQHGVELGLGLAFNLGKIKLSKTEDQTPPKNPIVNSVQSGNCPGCIPVFNWSYYNPSTGASGGGVQYNGDVITINCNESIEGGWSCGSASVSNYTYNSILRDAAGNIQTWYNSSIMNVPAGTSGTFYLSGYFYNNNLGGQLCDSVKITVNINCPTPASCINSYNVSYIKGGTNNIITCLDPPSIINVTTSDIFTEFRKNHSCNPSTATQVSSVTIYSPTNTIVQSSASSTLSMPSGFSFSQCGTYRVVFKNRCDNTFCDSCVIKVQVNCPPTIVCCRGAAGWTQRKFVSTPYQFPAAGLPILDTIKCINNRYMVLGYNCDSSCTTAQVGYQLINSSGAIVNQGVAISMTAFNMNMNIPNGIYTLRIFAICGIDTCNIELHSIVKNCPTLVCCPGSWTTKTMSINNGPFQNLPTCGSNIGSWGCDSMRRFNFRYQCPTGCSIGTINYQWRNTSTSSSSAIISVANGANANVPAPSSNGNYILSVWSSCNGVICDTCRYPFVVTNCIPSVCCPGSWTTKTMSINNGPFQNLPTCGSNIGSWGCDSMRRFNFRYQCPTGCSIGTINYQWRNTSTSSSSAIISVANGANANVPAPSSNGNYILSVWSSCNGVICDTCRYPFIVTNCSLPNCCTNGNFINRVYRFRPTDNWITMPLPMPSSNAIQIGCDTLLYTRISATCNPTCGLTSVAIKYRLLNFSGTSIITPLTSGNGPIHLNVPTGSYILRFYRYCNGVLCDSISYKLVKNCNCCKGGNWGSNTYINESGANITIPITPFLIQTGYNSTFTFNYQCNTNCPSPWFIYHIRQITSPTTYNTIYSGNGTQLNYNFTNPGRYVLIVWAICGGRVCDSIAYNIRAYCKPTCSIKIDSVDCKYSDSLRIYTTYTWNCTNLNNIVNIKAQLQNGTIINSNITPTYPAILGTTGGSRNYILTLPAYYGGQYIKVVASQSISDCIAIDSVIASINCKKCNVCDSINIGKNVIQPNPSSDFLNISGTISSTQSNKITKVVVILESLSARNTSLSIQTPSPNFEFVSNSTIGGLVSITQSLSGNRSNIASSTFTNALQSVPYNLRIDQLGNKSVLNPCRVRIIVFFENGTFCERYL